MAVPPVPARPPGNRIVPNPPPGGPALAPPPPSGNPTPGSIVTPPPYALPGADTTDSPQQGPQPLQPGTDLYDWHTINTALQNAGLNNWQIAGSTHSPVQQGQWVKDPGYEPLNTPQQNADAGHPDPFTYQANPNGYVIGVTNPATGQMLKLTLSRQGDPSTGYGWTVTGREDQGKLDKTQPGYTGVQRLPFPDGHEELWGTNSNTGAFEKMPGAPDTLGTLKGWNDIRQIEQNGQMVWVGTNPQGQPLQPIPGAPSINTAKYVPGSVKQVTKTVDGVTKQVYVGQNSQTQNWEDIPELGSENAPIKTTTVAGAVYKDNPNAGKPGEPDFVRVSGIATPNNGDRQWADAGGGYVKRQVYQNGAWGDVGPDDPEGVQRPVSPTAIAAQGALKPKGTKYMLPLPGSPDTLVEVTADGNGGYTYEPGPNGEPPKTMRIPGIAQPTTVSGAGTDEFLPARRDPITNQLLPAEKNPNWQTTGPADRVRQLREIAIQKQQEIHQQVQAGSLTDDQADQQFNTWWDGSIQPALEEVKQAQQQKQIDTQLKVTQDQRAQDQQRNADYTTALQAGSNAVEAQKALLPYMVGPGFGAALNNIQSAYASGTKPGNIDLGSAVTFQLPDMQALATQATNQALAHLSPTASQNMNQQTGAQAQPGLPQQIPNYDYTQSMQQSQYRPSGGGATTTVSPDGTVHVQQAQQPGQTAPPPPPAASPLPGQNYGPSTGYTGGVLPINQPLGQPAIPANAGMLPFQNTLSAAMAPYQLS
jgi:hypothetical protein